MTFSVCISSYGRQRWELLAKERAYPSAATQEQVDEVVIYHDPKGTVASVRNETGNRAAGDYLVFLDADDELAPGYIVAMKEALATHGAGMDKLLLAPAVSYITGTARRPVAAAPKFWTEVPLRKANWLVIGTAIPRHLFLSIGGFADEPAFGAFEDYEMWVRADKAGAIALKVPGAVYRAWWDSQSRHRGASPRERAQWHYEIGKRHYPDIYTEAWFRRRVAGMR